MWYDLDRAPWRTLRQAADPRPEVALLRRAAYLRRRPQGERVWLPLGRALLERIAEEIGAGLGASAAGRLAGVPSPEALLELLALEVDSPRQLEEVHWGGSEGRLWFVALGLPEEREGVERWRAELIARAGRWRLPLAWGERALGPQGTGWTLSWTVPPGTPEAREARVCPRCGAAYDPETAPGPRLVGGGEGDPPPAPTPVETPDCPTIAALAAFLQVPQTATLKALFWETAGGELVFGLVRGDREVALTKAEAWIGARLRPASPERIRAAGAEPGYASPVGLKGLRILLDRGVDPTRAYVVGANRPGWHLRGVVPERDFPPFETADLARLDPGDPCPSCGEILQEGRRHPLGRLEWRPAPVRIRSAGGERPVWARILELDLEAWALALAAVWGGERGLLWPVDLAPLQIHVLALGEDARRVLEPLAREAAARGWRVGWDARAGGAGARFADAELLGAPAWIVAGRRTLAEGRVEVRWRPDGETLRLEPAEVLPWLGARLKG